MKNIVITLVLLVFLIPGNAQTGKPDKNRMDQMWGESTISIDALKAGRGKLFDEGNFGMFIHWGASSVLGHGEWVMNDRNIKVSDYKWMQDGKERLGKLHSFYESTIN